MLAAIRFVRPRWLAALILVPGLCTALSAESPPALQALIKQHCLSCHDGKTKKGQLDLAALKYEPKDRANFDRWVQVHDRVRSGEMPPSGRPRPDLKALPAVLDTLQSDLAKADAGRRRVVLRRLNRVEYENTVRDLFSTRVAVRELLPQDTTANGFDTNGDALGVSVEQMQAYLEAADSALDTVFGPAREPKKLTNRFPLIRDCKRGGELGKMFREMPEGVAIFNSGYNPSNAFSAITPSAGTYRFRIHARAFQSEKPVAMQVTLGDVITNRRPFRIQGYHDLSPDRMQVVEFTEWCDAHDTIHVAPYGIPSAGAAYGKTTNPGIIVGDIEVEGPLEPWPPVSRGRLLGKVDPKTGTIADAEAILQELLPRAFRRPVPNEERKVYVKLVQEALSKGRPFEQSLRVGLKAVLCSPAFLYREEPPAESGPRRVTANALAVRLSYLLWSSTPDAALVTAARNDDLDRPDRLHQQVERMLADPGAAAFTANFTGQWLSLRDIDATQPDGTLYPEYDAGLKLAILDETRLYFNEMLGHNRDLREFVASDWTFLNERLARHYDIPGVSGSSMRKVKLLPESVRGGLLTQASVLKVTANGTNTSPVLRGTWVLANILGTPAPPPPSGVPAVEPDIRGTTTLREQLAKHRDSASCAGCHRRIDPPGFALESFDVIGGQREWYRSLGAGERVNRKVQEGSPVNVRYRKGPPVDPSGEMADGARFADVREFKKLLVAEPDRLARNLVVKLLTYGLGREIGFADRPAVEQIVAKVRAERYGFRSLVHAVIQSDLFRQP